MPNFGPEKIGVDFRTFWGRSAWGSESARNRAEKGVGNSEIWLVWGRHGSVWAGIRSIRIQMVLGFIWTCFQPIWTNGGVKIGSFPCFQVSSQFPPVFPPIAIGPNGDGAQRVQQAQQVQFNRFEGSEGLEAWGIMGSTGQRVQRGQWA